MVHDLAEQGHDKYNSFLSSSSFNSKQTQVNINFIIVLSSLIGLHTVTNWNRSYLQCSQYN